MSLALLSMKRRAASIFCRVDRAPHRLGQHEIAELGRDLLGLGHPALLDRVERVAGDLHLVEAALAAARLPVDDHDTPVGLAVGQVHAQEDLGLADVERDEVLERQPALAAELSARASVWLRKKLRSERITTLTAIRLSSCSTGTAYSCSKSRKRGEPASLSRQSVSIVS